jgi:hypothetical protein
MVNDPEDKVDEQIVHTLTGQKFLVKLPDNVGRVVGICKFRDNILIATEYGYLYQWDCEREVLELIHNM